MAVGINAGIWKSPEVCIGTDHLKAGGRVGLGDRAGGQAKDWFS